jgi:phosphatidylserine decarboxylase
LRIHREGYPFLLAFGLATIALFLVWKPLGWAGLVLTLWCGWFFRDPDRLTPRRPGAVISPADGVVCAVVSASPPPELGMSADARIRISVFLNLFDVHVNRVPADGLITAMHYRAGKFLNASFDKASEDNERQAVAMKLADGRDLAFVQIAGLVARRIKCDLVVGQTVLAGERFGIIRFGSRADVYLPFGYRPTVGVGERVLGGVTVLADPLPFPGAEAPAGGAA